MEKKITIKFEIMKQTFVEIGHIGSLKKVLPNSLFEMVA